MNDQIEEVKKLIFQILNQGLKENNFLAIKERLEKTQKVKELFEEMEYILEIEDISNFQKEDSISNIKDEIEKLI